MGARFGPADPPGPPAPQASLGRRPGTMTETKRAAIVLLSGGLDSSTCLLIARDEGFDVYALSFDYGQRHRLELDRAAAIALRHGAVSHRVARIDLPGAG